MEINVAKMNAAVTMAVPSESDLRDVYSSRAVQQIYPLPILVICGGGGGRITLKTATSLPTDNRSPTLTRCFSITISLSVSKNDKLGIRALAVFRNGILGSRQNWRVHTMLSVVNKSINFFTPLSAVFLMD